MTTLQRGVVLLALATAGITLVVVPAGRAQDNGKALAAQAEKILRGQCLNCHGGKPGEIDGRLDILNPADIKRVVDVDEADKSRLLRRIQDSKKRMPPPEDYDGNPLKAVPEADVEVLRKWIAAGAPPLPGAATAPAVVVQVVPEPPLPLGKEVQKILQQNCGSCHHGRANPSGGVNILNPAHLKKSIVARDPDASRLVQLIEYDASNSLRMPPPGDGHPGLSEAQVRKVRDWIASGDVSFEPVPEPNPSVLGDEYVLESISNDIRTVLQKHPQDQDDYARKYRYFSINHLLASGASEEVLQTYRQAFTLVINHLTWERRLVQPQWIESTRTVCRVDISRASGLGWDEQPFLQMARGQSESQAARSKMTLYDLVLLDYPFGQAYTNSNIYRLLMRDFLTPAEQIRPVAFVRIDWFINAAAQPPLYHDLLQLPTGLKDLEKLLDVDSQGNLDQFRAWRAATTASGVSRNNRAVDRHPGTRVTPYYYASHDFVASRGLQNIFRNFRDLRPVGGEMIFGLPNGMQGYYIADGKNDRLDFAPTDIVVDPSASDKIVRNGLACIRCHYTGIKAFRDEVRPQVLKIRAANFSRNEVLRLFKPQPVLDRDFDADARLYQKAVETLFNGKTPDIKGILELAATDYQDQALSSRAALAELGESRPWQDEVRLDNGDLALVGLSQLAYGGFVRRDTWEDVFDHAIRVLNRRDRVPLVPLDGQRMTEYQNPAEDLEIQVVPLDDLKKGPSNDNDQLVQVGVNSRFFAQNNQLKNELKVGIRNNSSKPLFVEVVMTGARGRKAILLGVTEIPANQTATLPTLEDQGGTGKEHLTIYASRARFGDGFILRLPENLRNGGRDVADRLVHPELYQLNANGPTIDVAGDAARITKKTVDIETR